MLTIAIDERGLWTVCIDDAAGNPHDYAVKRLPPGLDCVAVSLTRLDTGAVYRVATDRAGVVRCSCKAWRFRRGKDGMEPGCKHSRSVKRLLKVIAELCQIVSVEGKG